MTEAFFTPKTKPGYYYGSDLNLFIDECCSHEMDCINIDCLLVKVSKHRIRFIESKKGLEPLPRSEDRVFNIISFVMKRTSQSQWKLEFYIVRGNYPFQFATVSQFGSNDSQTLTGEQLRDWLDFKIELTDIPKEAP